MKLLAPLLVLLVVPSLAPAQVVVNPAALQQLAGIVPPAPPPVAAPAMPRHRVVYRVMRKPAVYAPAATVIPAVAKPVPPPPPPAAPVNAPPVTSPPPGPVTLHFALGTADLPPGAAALLKPLCGSKAFIAINATAPGSAADPSIAMRLSLSRALAVRDALTACGVKGTSILPRALGDIPGRDANTTVISVAK